MKKGIPALIAILIIAALVTSAVILTQNTSEAKLPLEITTPEKESIVTSPEILVEGITTADAVVSINEAIIAVDEEGKFSTELILGEGPNLIEIIASDYEDNEASVLLTVIYVP